MLIGNKSINLNLFNGNTELNKQKLEANKESKKELLLQRNKNKEKNNNNSKSILRKFNYVTSL